ncbi:MAG: hypothetical protein IKG87_10130 [Clostridia bacterium]|nr:hypothetical protein [Clostridia bacterium]
MKRILSVLLCLAMLLPAAAVLAEDGVQEEVILLWKSYELKITWLTTNNAEIGIPNMRDDGLFVLVRFEGAEAPVLMEDIQAIEQYEFVLADAEGNEYGISTWLVHNIIQPEGGGFPSKAPEQDCFDLLFFLEGKTEEAAAGAQLRIGDLIIDLDKISRERPAEE